jgi:LETM1 and EF-hand domain-containing protein 1, mitochondrial
VLIILGRRGFVVGSFSRTGISTNDVVKVLAVKYVDGMRAWKTAQKAQQRNVSTETHSPDPKPFPLPTKPSQQQQSNARAPPPPMPPQPPRTDSLKSPESDQSVSADSAKSSATPSTVSDTTALTDKSASTSVEKKDADKKEKSDKKLTIWQKVKKEANHYWDGTKLLGKEIRISFRLALKMAAGYELSRRESRQLKRTTEDLIRLVPFSVFVIVPFAELLLPVALKLFPNMLPSTYEGETAREAKRAELSKTRKDVSTFLRTTIQESGLYISKATKQSEAFSEFFKKVIPTLLIRRPFS